VLVIVIALEFCCIDPAEAWMIAPSLERANDEVEEKAAC
jgi:hypothetical protein